VNRVVRHIVLPALAPASIVVLYFTPLTLISCVNRGLIALAVAFVSLVVGIVLGIIGIQAVRRDPESRWWWIGSMFILLLPMLLLLGPLG